MGKSKKEKKEKSKKRKREESDTDDSDNEQVVVPEQISASDYFRMATPFTVWLKKKKGVFFDQLDGAKSRKLFDKFVAKWNDGALKQKYYDLSTSVPPARERTGYKWKFAKTLDKTDKKSLEHLKDNVERSRQSDALGTGAVLTKSVPPRKNAQGPTMPKVVQGPVMPKAVQGPVMPSRSELDAYSAQLKQKDRRDFRKEQAVVLDELTGGKATGYEAKREKRLIGKQERQAREISPDVPGGDPYSGDSFKAAVAKKERYLRDKQAKKKEASLLKLEEHRTKEKEKMAALMEMARAGRSNNALYQPAS